MTKFLIAGKDGAKREPTVTLALEESREGDGVDVIATDDKGTRKYLLTITKDGIKRHPCAYVDGIAVHDGGYVRDLTD